MSGEAKDQAEAKTKGKGAAVKAAMALALVGAGGGGVYGLLQAGVLPGGGKEAKEDHTPKLILKGEEDPYAPPAAEGEGSEAPDVSGEGGSKYRTAYFTFSDNFTSNLKNSTGLIQVSLAASTHRDGRVLMWLKKHELAVRSRILIVLADTPEEELLTPEGKELLQKRITDAINQVLIEAEGFGGIDAVYFRSLLVQ
ncbi:MAG: flagellar basal body-associated FliL family protein [Novosphingobium sp.]|nr:flagellar basal body-associated FliL family protein [Novosphingobium sp.]